MPSTLRSALIATRASQETKSRFVDLASARGVSESALLGALIDAALAQTEAVVESKDGGVATDRITLRMRPGDRAMADARAAERAMKTSSYLVMLMRAHLRASPVMPLSEINELKAAVGRLSALDRQLHAITETHPSVLSADSSLRDLLMDVGHMVEHVREMVSQVVRVNLRSWEAGHA